jgi:hypothetical protein
MSDDVIAFQTIKITQIYLNSSLASLYKNSTMKSLVVYNLQDTIPKEQNILEAKLSLVNAQIPNWHYSFNYWS